MHAGCCAGRRRQHSPAPVDINADSNATYAFVAGEGATGAFDLVVSLHTQAGDADL